MLLIANCTLNPRASAHFKLALFDECSSSDPLKVLFHYAVMYLCFRLTSEHTSQFIRKIKVEGTLVAVTLTVESWKRH